MGQAFTNMDRCCSVKDSRLPSPRDLAKNSFLLFFVTVTEEKLQVAQEHIESLEQQLADSEKKASDVNQKGKARSCSE